VGLGGIWTNNGLLVTRLLLALSFVVHLFDAGMGQNPDTMGFTSKWLAADGLGNNLSPYIPMFSGVFAIGEWDSHGQPISQV